MVQFLKLHDLTEFDKMEGIRWRSHKLKHALEKNPKLINPTLTPPQLRMLKVMLLETAGCLATRIEDLLQPCKVDPIEIPTSSPPIRQKPYKLSPTDLEFLQPTVESMLQAGVLQASSSPWASPVFVVYRQHHEKSKAKPRKVVDYRRLNATVPYDSYPLPDIHQLLDSLQGAKFFGALDLKSGFWQVPLSADAALKTAFTCSLGLF